MVRDSTKQSIVFVENYTGRDFMISMKNTLLWDVTPYNLVEEDEEKAQQASRVFTLPYI
jgi:hypothetical protein